MQKSSKVKLNSGTRVPASRYVLFLILASLGCYADLATKRWVFGWLGMPGENPPWWLIPEYVGIETSLNTGGLGGFFENGVTYLAVFSLIALVGIIFWFVWYRVGNDLWMTWILGIITGGILGNLYDRLGLWSPVGTLAVRDWILFQYSRAWRWPNFNIADSLLVCGAIMLFLYSMINPPANTEQPADEAASNSRT